MSSLSAANEDENVVTIKNLNFRYDTGAPLNINGLDCVIPANARIPKCVARYDKITARAG